MSVEHPLPPPEIENLLAESRLFPPDPAFAAQANATEDLYAEAEADFEAFWAKRARERISWTKPFDKTLEWELPFAKWFTGGELNVAYNCVDRHVENGLGDKVAYHWIGEPGDTRTLTFRDLLREVSKTANALKELGVGTGDRVAIYMPMIPELPIAMLACARIGAPHTVIFGGFSAESLSGRINDCGAKVLITADGGYRRGKEVGLKHHADEAISITPTIEATIVVKRLGHDVHMVAGRDHWWHDLVDRQSEDCPPVAVDSEHMLYLLYTSGTTAKPKGILHTTAGYLLGTSFSHEAIFDIKPDDVYWCAADIGWVTGHSYIVYGPLANATTGVMYEGAPDTPAWDRWWQIVEDYKVTILYCAPTAIRAFMKQGVELPAAARPVDAARPRVGRRADQPGSLDVVPRAHRRRQGAGRRHVVADRDRPDHDQRAARRHDDQARLGDVRVPGHRRRRRRRRRRLGPARRRRLPRAHPPVAGDAPRHLRRPGALQADLLEPLPRDVLRRRRRQARPGRLPVAARPGRRRHERGRPPHLHHGGRIRAGRPQGRRRGRRGRQEGRRQRPGDLRLTSSSRRTSSRPTPWPSSCASTSPMSSGRSPGRSS